jgi:hypothetical protein
MLRFGEVLSTIARVSEIKRERPTFLKSASHFNTPTSFVASTDANVGGGDLRSSLFTSISRKEDIVMFFT